MIHKARDKDNEILKFTYLCSKCMGILSGIVTSRHALYIF